MSDGQQLQQPWYRDVTKYQWLVLIMASLGWVFDAFEGQLFVACMKEALSELVPELHELEQKLAMSSTITSLISKAQTAMDQNNFLIKAT